MSKRNIVISIFTVITIATVIAVTLMRKEPSKYYTRYGIQLGTEVEISYATDRGNAKTVVDNMFEKFNYFEKIFDPWFAGSELYNLNHSGGKWVKVSPELMKVLKYSIKIARLTNGTFDPTVGRLVPLWGFNTDNTHEWRLPSTQEISNALKHVGYQNVEISGDEVRLLNGVWLDLNGMMEGYLDQLMIEMAKANDPHSTGYVDIGGTVGIIGPKNGDQPWVIGIRNPRGTSNSAIAYVKLYNGYVGTSGDYERYIVVDGKRYYHIFDPKSGYSNDYFESVTTVSTESMLSDGFGVFAMVNGPLNLNEWAKRSGVSYFAIAENGATYENTSWKAYEYNP